MHASLDIPHGTSRTSQELVERGITRPALRTAVRGGLLTRPFRDTYVNPATLEDPVAMARIALAVLGDDAVIGRQTAACLHGLTSTPPSPVHVLLPNGSTVRRRKLLAPHYATWSPADVTSVQGIACTRPERTVVDLARVLPAGEALAVVDSALRMGISTAESLAEQLSLHYRWRGIVGARRVVSLGDPRAESPMESILRLVMIDGGLTQPVPQYWVEQANARIDLALPPWRVAVEFASRIHHEGWRQVQSDKGRDRRLVACGWVVLHFTAREVLRYPERVVAQVTAALRQQGWSG